ncbi:MAG: 2Fe-2S iron-sulfur cluster-binding protein [Acidiferrobacteraceae bacterium]
MPEWLSLTRAARLIGVTRGMLQKKIQQGELVTFEGKVAISDLVTAYPAARIEDNSAIERFTRIKDNAFAHRVRERILPDPEVLLARIEALTRELVSLKSEVKQKRVLLHRISTEIAIADPGGATSTGHIVSALRLMLKEQELAPLPPDTSLLIQNHFLRIMTAQIRLLPSNHEFLIEGNDTILDAALRSGLSLSYGCSNGNCGLCKAKVVSGATKKIRHSDFTLTEAEKTEGYVLLCTHTAVADLVIEAKESGGTRGIPLQHIVARVKTVQQLSEMLALLHLQTPRTSRLRFLAGQRVTLTIGGEALDASIASCPCDDRNLQFHLPQTALSDGIKVALRAGDAVALEGPRGDFVLNEESHRPLLFIAWGTGFAPVKSLIEHAMALNSAESISLYWIDESQWGHYMHNLCRSWSDALDNFRYTPLVAASEPEFTHTLDGIVSEVRELGGHDAYVAGPKTRAEAIAERLNRSGLPMAQLFVDYL